MLENNEKVLSNKGLKKRTKKRVKAVFPSEESLLHVERKGVQKMQVTIKGNKLGVATVAFSGSLSQNKTNLLGMQKKKIPIMCV